MTVDFLAAGGVRVGLSVLNSPFDEMDLDEPYGAPPEPGYFARPDRAARAGRGGDRRARRRDGRPRRARARPALADGAVGLVHCVEGGFHLGATPEEVDANVTALAQRGVAYVTLAHLFWRRVAANAPALPFLPGCSTTACSRSGRARALPS